MDGFDYVSAAADMASDRAREDFLDNWRTVAEHCDSPLEQVFLAYLMLEASGLFSRISWFGGGRYLAASASSAGEGLCAFIQGKTGPYYPDFYMEFHNQEFGEKWFRLAVECDGHEFHEKTKQQVARDKRRDRWFALNGISLVRFSGHEIWRAPVECAEQVFEIYHAAHRRRRAEHAA